MKYPARNQRPLLDPWFDWHELTDDVRQHVLDVLTALYLETVDSPYLEPGTDDSSDH